MIKKFGFTSCLSLLWLLFVGGRHADIIRCWQVSCRLPHYNEQGQLDSFITLSRQLYIEGQLMMYIFNGNECYLFHKDSLSGIHWDIRNSDLPGPFRVDSLQHTMTPYLTHFGLFKKGFGRLVSTGIDARTGSLKETYCDINFHKHPNTDSCYVTYTDRFNFLPPDMSLNYSLDSLYGKRLCEVRFVSRSEWIWKLEEVRDFDRAIIQSYFSR